MNKSPFSAAPGAATPRGARQGEPARWVLVLALATAALVASSDATAQWLWRGTDGRVTASDRPPPAGVPDKDIIKRPGGDAKPKAAPQTAGVSGVTAAAEAPGSAVASSAPQAPASAKGGASAPQSGAPPSPQSTLDKEIEAKKRAAEQEKVAKAKAEEERVNAIKDVNCRSARSHASTLENGARIARNNDKGEREFVDDRTRADELRRAREVIASDCR